jgi:hypothetical protein
MVSVPLVKVKFKGVDLEVKDVKMRASGGYPLLARIFNIIQIPRRFILAR